MYSAIARNKRNTVLIIVLFVVLMAGLASIFSLVYQDWSITVIVFVIAIGYAVFQYFMATRQTLSMAHAHEVQKQDHPRLYRIVENLAITEGMPMPKVYVIADPAPNAFATGRDPEHAVVAATTGLLELMDDAELEGVMAHELGHVKNYDIRVSLIVFGLVVAIGLIADFFLRFLVFGGRGRSNNSNAGPLMIVFLVIGVVAALVAPLVAGAVQAAVSRQREYLADATGALTTRHPEALASALLKLQTYGRPVTRTNTSMSHLWISDPNKPGFMARLFSTHPPIEDRVARLRGSLDRF
ncbi:M48 family metalloprotease [Homoserinibacter sp. YIM 151385]|uniref:M48 family metalloprotease n=1 Tax=Homoserinibacter sp. YIM 151385 TaxID=2985506 RepID=UPI0022F10CEA|nr:M48 family metalloprotease [Homoserinibacter sp. YIM 151385]WBU38058.1 M48 family metalloprotease [Homoserinibacter sp. YIM 151385]